MATDQVIEIKFALRDEISKAAEQAVAKLLRLNEVRTDRARAGFLGLGRMAEFARREIRSLMTVTGVGGILGAGGIVAGLVAAKRSLDAFSESAVKLHFASREMRISEETLSRYTGALKVLGDSEEGATGQIRSAMNTLEDAWTEGKDSKLFKDLSGAIGGQKLFNDLMRAYSRGPEHALDLTLDTLEKLEKVNVRSATWFAKAMGFAGLSATEIRSIQGRLVPVMQMSKRELLEYRLANENLSRSWTNITVTLGRALIPAFTNLTKAITEYVNSPAGQYVLEKLKGWINLLADYVRSENFAKSMKEGVDELEKQVKLAYAAFKQADELVQKMGWSWTGIFKTLIAIKVAAWLGNIALGLSGLIKYRGLLMLLTRLSPLALLWLFGSGRTLSEKEQKDIEEGRHKPETPQERFQKGPAKQLWDWLFGKKPEKQSGLDKSPTENLADAQQDRLAKDLLTQKFAALDYSLTKLVAHTLPGGPEGKAGEAGYELSRPRTQLGDTFVRSKETGNWIIRALGAAKRSAPVIYPNLTAGEGYKKNPFWQSLSGEPGVIEFARTMSESEMWARQLLAMPAITRASAEYWQRGEEIAGPNRKPSFGVDWGAAIENAATRGPPLDYLLRHYPNTLGQEEDLPPMRRRFGLTAGGGNGGTLGEDLGIPGDVGARSRIPPWEAPTLPQLSPIIAPPLRGYRPRGPEMQPLGGVDVASSEFTPPSPGGLTSIFAREQLNGSGSVDIDISDVTTRDDYSGTKGLFRSTIIQSTPQMAATGSDKSVPSNYNRE